MNFLKNKNSLSVVVAKNETLSMSFNSYRSLIVWQKAIDLVVDIYTLTEQFPSAEKFGLISQMRRSAVSIASNIAEGKYRRSKKDYVNFLSIAFSSGAELETQIIISKRLQGLRHLDYTSVDLLLLEIMRMLNALICRLRSKPTVPNLSNALTP